MISKKVLLCDDAPPILLTMKKVMSILGVPDSHVSTATNGLEAVDVFKAENPNVVFIDLVMPKMDGEAAAREMMALNPEVRIILVTGTSRDDERVRRIVSDGAFEVLEKPIRLADVSAIFQGIEREELGLRRVS